MKNWIYHCSNKCLPVTKFSFRCVYCKRWKRFYKLNRMTKREWEEYYRELDEIYISVFK